MNLENWIALIGAIAVLIYLIFTLLRPERF